MEPVGKALAAALKDRVAIYNYDYSTVADHWAGSAEVAGCLALYLHAVATAAGSDGKVFVVGHSMGGLAVRYASALTVGGRPVGDLLGGVVTLNTPHLGSYWSSSGYAGAWAQLQRILSGFRFPLPGGGSDAATCLARFGEAGAVSGVAAEFPAGCGPVAPYLPESVPLSIVRGLVSIQRTIFKIPVYTYSIDGDGVVDSTSQGLYARSGPADAKAGPYTVTDITCTVRSDALVAGAKAASPRLAALVIAGVAELDNAAMTEVLAGRVSLKFAAALVAAEFFSTCGHDPLLSNADAHKAAIASLAGWLDQLDAIQLKPYVGGYYWACGDWSIAVEINTDLSGEVAWITFKDDSMESKVERLKTRLILKKGRPVLRVEGVIQRGYGSPPKVGTEYPVRLVDGGKALLFDDDPMALPRPEYAGEDQYGC
jgi:pimeloyl-ACP methyl ester carboxylesterase